MNRAIAMLLVVIAALLGWMVYRSESDRADAEHVRWKTRAEAMAIKALHDVANEVYGHHQATQKWPVALADMQTDRARAALAEIEGAGYAAEYAAGGQRFGIALVPGPKMVGMRSFWVDETGVIRQAFGRQAKELDPPVR